MGYSWPCLGGHRFCREESVLNDEGKSKAVWAKSWDKNTCRNKNNNNFFFKKETLCLGKQWDWESADGSKTGELDKDMMVGQARWGSRNRIQLKGRCRRSLNHTSWSVSMGKCQGCPTVKEELWMNFPTYPGKMKAAQSWVQQTQSPLLRNRHYLCSSARGKRGLSVPLPQNSVNFCHCFQHRHRIWGGKIIKRSLRLKNNTLIKTTWAVRGNSYWGKHLWASAPFESPSLPVTLERWELRCPKSLVSSVNTSYIFPITIFPDIILRNYLHIQGFTKKKKKIRWDHEVKLDWVQMGEG